MPKRFLSGQRSQAMPEFALVAPVFLLIVFGIFDFGHGVADYVAIQHAANEGGRVAAEGYPLAGSSTAFMPPNDADVTGATIKDTAALRLVSASSCPNGPIPSTSSLISTIPANEGYVYVTDPEAPPFGGSVTADNLPGGETTCPGSQAANSEPLQVTVIYHFSPITPLISNIIGRNLLLVAYSVYETEY